MKVFILEDDEQRLELFRQALRGEDVIVTTHVLEATEKFEWDVDLLLLDHDLGGEVYVDSTHGNTGAAFCRWLVNQDRYIPPVVIHSWNPDGAAEMKKTLHDRQERTTVVVQPFGPTLLRMLGE